MRNAILTPRFFLTLAMVLAGVAMRVIPHPWNFAPIGAIALFAGAHFERRGFALAIPLVAMFLGDTLMQVFTGHGYHALMPVIYATYALIAVIGMLVRERRNSVAVVGLGALLSSAIFFVVTNFAMWSFGTTYAKTAGGLVACYIAGIPFLGNTIASDLIFTAILFGAFALTERRVPMFAPARG